MSAVTAGLFTVLAELVESSITRGAHFSSVAALFGPAARTLLAVAAAAAIVGVVSAFTFRGLGVGSGQAMAGGAAAAGLIATAILAGPQPPSVLPTIAGRAAAAMACCIGLAATLALAAKGLSSRLAERAASLLAAAPWALAAAFLLQLRRTSLRGMGEEPRLLETALFGAVLLILLGVAWRVSVKRWTPINLSAAAAAVIVGFLPPSEIELAASEKVGGEGLRVRHVVLVTIDTLRRDSLSLYGGSNPTPHVDGLAADSVVFTQASTPSPWTLPSVTSILTGVAPGVHGALRLWDTPATEIPSLGDWMGQAGYATAAAGWNYFLSPRGAGGYLGERFDQSIFGPPPDTETMSAKLWQAAGFQWAAADPDAEDLTRLAKRWFEDHQDRPFFFWVHYFDPHLPYAPPSQYRRDIPASHPDVGETYDEEDLTRSLRGELPLTPSVRRFLRELYDAEVRYVDDKVGELIDALKSLGIYDDALIVLTSDHGEEFGERGRLDHGHSLFQELTATPLVIKLPGSSFKGAIDRPVSNTAVAATILDLTQLDEIGRAPEGASFSSSSLAPLWSDESHSVPATPVFTEGALESGDKEAVRLGDYKAIRYIELEQVELFDLSADPAERFDRSGDLPEIAAEYERLLDERRASSLRIRDRLGLQYREEDLDEGQRERLRSLGYIQ